MPTRHKSFTQPYRKDTKDLAKHGLKSEAEGKILAMIGLAESEPGIPIVPDDMDRDPWLFNVPNGTLNLKSGELLPHTRENLLTKISPVEYHPETPCPFWQDHLKRIFQGNENLISFVQIALGYSLAGITDERAMFICYGRGSNGKTTSMEVIADILGDYAVRTPTESILIKREGAIPNDLAKLKGARFVYCSETEEGKRLAESLIKDLTGGDTVSARFMRGEWFTFRPEFKLWLSTNHRPVVRGTDDAIWARLRLIPFNFQFPEQERIPRSRLWEKITPELPGILAWAVQGCKDWRQFGLFQPDEVKIATQSYRAEMDILGKFLDERCCINKRAEAAAKELYSAYSKWCEENGERGVSQRVFSVRLTEKGFQNQRTRAGYVWLGIGLNEGETREAREAREPILTIIRENSNI
ncbi:MAG: phage/plasmid primase, P4 family [Pseudomonadota bacterium]